MNKYYTNEYPYGQFPFKFTKHGQQQYFEELTTPKVNTLSVEQPAPTQEPQPTQNNNFDISKLLPLLKLMGDKKSMSNSDMLQMLIPMLSGSSANMSELLSLFNKEKPPEEIVEDISDNDTKIDEYRRVE